MVIRNINVGQGTNTLTIDGHQTFWEPRYRDALGTESSPIDTIHTTVSEKYTLILKGGAGGPDHIAGDYIYHDGENRRFVGGAWGILRVLPGDLAPELQPLPGISCPPSCRPARQVPRSTPSPSARSTCRARCRRRQGRPKAAFVPTSLAAAVIAKTVFPEPLVMHVAAGECIRVTLTNQRTGSNASFHVGVLLHDLNSSGINVGNNPGDQTVAPGGQKTYTYYADTQRLESTMISDFGGDNSGLDGLYGSVVVAPAGATFTDPESGQATDIGSQVDVHVPGQAAYRDFTLLLADHDPRIGQSTMPYPSAVSGPALVNYRNAGIRPDSATMFSSSANGGDPATPILQAYAGDPVKVHVLGAPASDQVHVFNLGGMSWPGDMYIPNSSQWQSRGVGPWEKLDITVSGGAGGAAHAAGRLLLRRPPPGVHRGRHVGPLPGPAEHLRGERDARSHLPGRDGHHRSADRDRHQSGQRPVHGRDARRHPAPASNTAAGGTAVAFVGTAGTGVACASTTSCTATSPAGTGTVHVVVTAHSHSSATTAPTSSPTR